MPSPVPKTKSDTLAMKTSKLIAVAFLLVSGTGVCRSNLCETEAQCITRYGNESDVTNAVGYRQVGDKAASFNIKTASGSLDIRVIFLNGLSCHESISNADYPRGLSEDQMKTILDSQSAGFKWRKRKNVYHTDRSDETSEAEDWLRSDGATAIFTKSGKADSLALSGQMELSTKQYADAQHFYDKENGDN
jgi:hypothetical protein